MLEQSYRRPDPSLLPIPRPGCPKCECRMMLLGIVIGAEGSEVCSFKCTSCGHGFMNAVAQIEWLDCRRIEAADLKRARLSGDDPLQTAGPTG